MAHIHSHSHDSGAVKNLSTALYLNAFFVVVEVVGGIFTNSIAILTDALHDFGDCLSLATARYLQKKSARGRDARYSYGYKRFSLLGTVFLSGVLTLSSVWVGVAAVGRLIDPQPVRAEGMLWIAVFGVVINGAAALRVSRGHSLNERAVFLHIMEDVLGWVAVLVVSVVMLFVDFPILDPLLSIAISVWVLSNVYQNVRATFEIFLQGVPHDVSVPELERKMLSITGVESIHDLHLWSLDGESHVMTAHIVTRTTNLNALREALLATAQQFHITHSTLEFESPDAPCLHSCDSADSCKA